MDALLQIIKDNTGSLSLFYFSLLLLICAKGITFTRELKTATVYIAIYLLISLELVDGQTGILILFAVLFALNELFTNDYQKIKRLNIFEKLTDYSYKILIEDHIVLACVSILLMLLSMASAYNAVPLYFSLLLMTATVFMTVRSNYSTKTLTEIIDCLSRQNIYDGEGVITEKDKILLELEDSTFKNRNKHSHNTLSLHILRKVRRYIKANYALHPIRTARTIFSRGYATIEMQLIRSIGVENGYDRHIYRRKAFEIIYSNLVFNALQREYGFERNTERFKKWILDNYMYNVRIKLYGRVYLPGAEKSTFVQLFKKEYSKLNNEQFFVWCLGLTHISNIGPKTIERRFDVIERHKLRLKRIERILKDVSPYELDYNWTELYELYV